MTVPVHCYTSDNRHVWGRWVESDDSAYRIRRCVICAATDRQELTASVPTESEGEE